MHDPSAPIHSPFTCDTFAPLVGETFNATLPDGTVAGLVLISADLFQLKPFDGRVVGKSGFVRRDPFHLLFRWNGETIFRQGLYPFTHPQLGSFEMLIVPVGPGETGWLYEAVFN